ncbi:MAG TPA: nicotinate (nicotinamide) nucleotide adenylyltransferase [Firmicutes bacterium]|jgi:nicotinate-nucleotide adenylyltransferase|nr:nicotinate (nicotinamide) nucleotide adenylyltransferase [Bacillota bacterium]HOQ24683.1 nicotinate-nucleotide adenylyltransferase [Bacillota bacterium]HPT68271.1 nicotinate-nucleotide adenylyltransferase [Bacillota bacterium]
MRTGIFGGSFDPIHLGHLLLAEAAWEELGLTRLIFVPAHCSPWKKGTSAEPKQRYAMVELAVKNRPGFEVSSLELDREPPSYTVETLRALRREAPDEEFWLILGADGIQDFMNWRESKEILTLANIAVGQRPGYQTKLPEQLQILGEERVRVLPGPCCDLSSTEIRERIAAGRSVRYRLTPEVEEYIKEHRLYR